MSSKKSRGAVALTLSGAVIVCVLIVTRGEYPECGIESLILDEEQMAERWSITDKEIWPAFLPARDRLGAEKAYRTVLKNDRNELIGHTVYQYHNRRLAAVHFWSDRAVFFPSVSTEWSVLEEANDLPLHADQVQIQCGMADTLHLNDRCVAVLRHGPYISNFSMSLGDGGSAGVEEFLEIVRKLDEQLGSCVE